MNRQELGYLRRQFKPDSTRLFIRTLVRAYCRADEGGKSIVVLSVSPFDELEEDDRQVYLASARKALSGKPGKNLLEIPVSDQQAVDFWKEVVFESWNEETIRPVIQKIVDSMPVQGPFYVHLWQLELNLGKQDDVETVSMILLTLHRTRELPEYIYYDQSSGSIRRMIPSELQLDPSAECSILYPSFDEHGSDWSDLVWRTGRDGSINENLLQNLFQAVPVLNAKEQNEAVVNIVETLAGDSLDLSVVQNLRKQVEYMQETSDLDADEPSLDVTDLETVLIACGMDEGKLEDLSEVYQKEMKDQRVQVSNIFSTPKMNLKMDGISVSVSQEALGRIHRTTHQGKDVLVIDLDGDLEADHFTINTGGSKNA